MTNPDQIFEPSALRRPAETFAFVVTSYDTEASPPAVLGRRIDNGQDVRVALTPRAQNSASVYSRTEIHDFAAPRIGPKDPSTEPGGILLAETAWLLSDRSWQSPWLHSLSHYPGESEVLIAPCTLSSIRPGKPTAEFPEGTPNFMLQFLSTGNFKNVSDFTMQALDTVPPFKVTSYEDLLAAGEHLISSEIGFAIRVSSPLDAVIVNPWSTKLPGGQVQTPYKVFYGALADLRKRLPVLDDGSVLCEIISFSRLFAGQSTAKHFATNLKARERLQAFNTFNDRSTVEGVYSEPHFTEAIVAIRLHEGSSPRPFITHVFPVRGAAHFTSMKDAMRFAATGDFAPQPPAERRQTPTSSLAQQRSRAADQLQGQGPAPTPPAARKAEATPGGQPTDPIPAQLDREESVQVPQLHTTAGRYGYGVPSRGAR